jgi:hypothetical protein
MKRKIMKLKFRSTYTKSYKILVKSVVYMVVRCGHGVTDKRRTEMTEIRT